MIEMTKTYLCFRISLKVLKDIIKVRRAAISGNLSLVSKYFVYKGICKLDFSLLP